MNFRLFLCFLIFFTLSATLAHDGWVAYVSAQPFRLSALGYLLEHYVPTTLMALKSLVSGAVWTNLLVPFLQLRALFVFSLLGLVVLVPLYLKERKEKQTAATHPTYMGRKFINLEASQKTRTRHR